MLLEIILAISFFVSLHYGSRKFYIILGTHAIPLLKLFGESIVKLIK